MPGPMTITGAPGGRMQRSTSRILTTHAGSLPRPADLEDAEERRDTAGAAYAETLRHAVREVVRQQADVGVDVVNDGELGKSGWTNYLVERLGGFEARPIAPGQSLLAAGQDR